MPIKQSFTIVSNFEDERLKEKDEHVLNPYFKRDESTLNKWFNVNGEVYENTNETDIFSSLISEQIEQTGSFATYILRSMKNIDYITGDIIGSNFKYSFSIAVRIDPTSGYGITDTLQSQFGYIANSPLTLIVSYDKIIKEIRKLNVPVDQEHYLEGMPGIREFPQPGDLVWLSTPTPGRLFEVQFADESSNVFFQGGRRMVYTLTCQLFNMSSETFSVENNTIPDFKNQFTEHPVNDLNKFDEKHIEKIRDNEKINKEAKQRILDEPNFLNEILKKY